LGSTDLEVWNEVGEINNPLGSILFLDVTPSPIKFYRALQQSSLDNRAVLVSSQPHD
jgi:hypothetical protein